MKRKKLMAVAAVFALLCAALVFTGCPQSNQNKGGTAKAGTANDDSSKKKDNGNKESDKKDKDDDTSDDARYAPFTGKFNHSLWRPKDNSNTESGHEYFYYISNGTVYYAVFSREKNQFVRAPEIGTVKNKKIVSKGDNKETPVNIVGSTLYVDPDGSKPMRFEQETDRGLIKAIKKYLE